MQNDRPKYAINLKDHRIVYRSKATDDMWALYRWIPNDVARAIMDGKLDAAKVVNVITKKMFSDENFDHNEYEAELRKLNVVFKEEEVPEPEEVVDTASDNVADSVTMEELTGGAPAPEPAPAPAPEPAPAAEADAGDGGDEPAPPKRATTRRQSSRGKKQAEEPAPEADAGDGEAGNGEAAPGDDETLDI